jgi:hypothetical protein
VRFETWHASRALGTVHDLELSPEQVHKRWYADFNLAASLKDVYSITKTPANLVYQKTQPRTVSAALLGILLWFITAHYVMKNNVPGLTRTLD